MVDLRRLRAELARIPTFTEAQARRAAEQLKARVEAAEARASAVLAHPRGSHLSRWPGDSQRMERP